VGTWGVTSECEFVRVSLAKGGGCIWPSMNLFMSSAPDIAGQGSSTPVSHLLIPYDCDDAQVKIQICHGVGVD